MGRSGLPIQVTPKPVSHIAPTTVSSATLEGAPGGDRGSRQKRFQRVQIGCKKTPIKKAPEPAEKISTDSGALMVGATGFEPATTCTPRLLTPFPAPHQLVQPVAISRDCAALAAQPFPIEPQISNRRGPLGVQAARPTPALLGQDDAGEELLWDPSHHRQSDRRDEDGQRPLAWKGIMDELERALAVADAEHRRIVLPVLRAVIAILGEHE